MTVRRGIPGNARWLSSKLEKSSKVRCGPTIPERKAYCPIFHWETIDPILKEKNQSIDFVMSDGHSAIVRRNWQNNTRTEGAVQARS